MLRLFDESERLSIVHPAFAHEVYWRYRLARLVEILKELLISNFMLIASSWFAAEDYMDMIQSGFEPEEGLQYLLAPCVTCALDNIRKKNAGLYEFLKKHNSDAMHFED